jgi:rhodanese-related sulfurtransferase
MEHFLVFLQKNPTNLLLLATVVITGGMLLWPFVSRFGRPGQEIGPTEAVQLINRRDAIVVDVRGAEQYNAGHITNARNVPEAEVDSRMKELEKIRSKPIIVTCGRGNTSAKVAARLRKLGFSEVLSLRGGIAGWQQASLPLEK